MDQEELTKQFNLISLAGTAKSLVYDALGKAADGDYQTAEEELKQADDYLGQTHDIQAAEIQKLVDGGDPTPVNLIDVHAQDHLMSAIEVRSLADVIIKLYKKIGK